MNAFKIIEQEEKDINGITRKRLVIRKKNKTQMTFKDIKRVAKLIDEKAQAKYKKDPQMVIRGMSTLGIRTLKAKKDDVDGMAEEYDEYLNGRVQEDTKFNEFFQTEFLIYV